ncbi:MAG: acyl-CoA dehydrogenase family protein [Salinirussus sp.]
MRLDADEQDFRKEVRTFVDEHLDVAYCRSCYQDREYPHELYDALIDAGLIGTIIPEDDGGRGRSHLCQAILMEALGTYGYDFAVPALTTATVTNVLYDVGDPNIRERFLPEILSGARRFTVGVTEPETGSNASGLATRAERDGDEYVVSGQKIYQSGAGVDGNVILTYVRTDPGSTGRNGISALLIPVDAEGVTATKQELVVRKASGTYNVEFDGVRVPVANRVGAEGSGWAILEEHLISEHTYIAAAMTGTAQTAVDTAIAAATDRHRFGKEVADFQAIRHRLADMQTEVDAAKLLAYRSAAEMDATGGTRALTARAKLKAGEVLHDVAREGMQILGGAAFDPTNDMERYWREGVSATVAGGTSEIQRSIIANDLLS